MKRTVGVNELGRRIGEDHVNARLTNSEVDLLLELWDEGRGMSYRQLGEKFDISKSGARKICKGQNRCQRATRYKTVHVSDDE